MVRWIFCFLLLPLASFAAQLKTQIDRTQLEQGDVFTLQITLEDLPLNAALPKLSLEPLKKQFVIVSMQQNRQLQVVNGAVHRSHIWQLFLAPKQTGMLLLPALSLGNMQTKPVQLHVRPLPPALKKQPLIYFSQQVDNPKPYVQQQVIYTLRLYYRGELHNGVISTPVPKGFQLLPLADEQSFAKLIDTKLYTVIERRYALFPQQAGPLTLPALRAEGKLYLQQQLLPVQAQANPLVLNVQPIPPNWPKTAPWLPAYELKINLKKFPEADTLKAGEAQTWQIDLYGKGVRGEQLPTLTPPKIQGLKIYPEPEQTETHITSEGIEGIKRITWTLIPQQAGVFHLPALQVPWWDLTYDQFAHVQLPQQKLHIQPAANTQHPAGAAPVSHPKPPSSQAHHPYLIAALILAGLVLSALGIRYWRKRIPASPFKGKTQQGQLCELPPIQFYNALLLRQNALNPALLPPDQYACLQALERALFKQHDLKRAKKLQQALCTYLNKNNKIDHLQSSHLKSIYPVKAPPQNPV